MADNARSPSICPWDPGEVCKAPHGASLPPRKRLLAGLKQNGWFCSTPPYFQGVGGASCAPEELRLEVDLRESKHECIADAFSSESPTRKQGECKAVEKLVSVKSKRATKRRKSLSVLVDCRNSVKNLHPELLKSCAENEIQERGRCNKVPTEALLSSNMEKASVHSYKQMVDDARAAAAKAAKAAAAAKAIALEKAVVAAKAAAIARAALEAVALAVENDDSECQPSRHVWAPCEQNRIGNGETDNGLLEKKKEDKRTQNDSVSSNENKKDEKTQAGKNSTAACHSVDIGTVLDGIKEDKAVHSGQNCIVALSSAGFDTPSDKHEEAEETQKTCAVACPLPPPFDDEKLARQLHRAMNSSPRIFRSRASLDYRRKIESFPSSIEGCTQIRCQQVGGCSSSREKKQIHKDKLRVSRSNNGKTKSMTAINDKLNMLQRATATLDGVLDTSREYANKFCQIDDNSASDDSDRTYVSFNKCIEKNGNFTGICDIDGSDKAGSKGEGNSSHCISYVHDSGTLGRDGEPNATKSSRIIRKLKSRRKKKTAVSFPVSHQSWDGNRANELPFTCNDIQSDTTLNVVSEQTGSHLETYDEDYEGRGGNQDGSCVSRPGTFVRGDASGTPTVKTTQENLIHSKSSRATRKIHVLSCMVKCRNEVNRL